MKQRLILIVSVVVGLLGALLARQYFRAKDRESEAYRLRLDRQYNKVDVLTVNADLPAGSTVTSDKIGSIKMVEAGVRWDQLRQKDAPMLMNRRTLVRLERGSPIFWSDIEGGDFASRGLAGSIKEGMRALSINASGAAAVSGMIRPNDRIDVLGTFSFPSATRPGELELVTLTIIQDVTVLATGRETAKSAAVSPERSSGYSMVTLEVTPREAEMLVFAEQIKGRLTLALRNPDDTTAEARLPRVNFERIETEIESLNQHRQQNIRKRRFGTN